MTFTFKPDYEQTRQRIEAFWNREPADRPVAVFHLAKPFEEQVLLPIPHHRDAQERWLDTQYQAEYALANLQNQLFLGDTLPIAWPNLGPEIFSVLYGCPLHFGDYGTSWTDPILHDWEQADQIQLDWSSPYLQKLIEMTDVLLELGKDRFIVGMSDWHPGGDCLAAFRDPQNLAMDLITNRAQVEALLARIEADYYAVYNLFYSKLHAAGQPITTWTPLVSEGKYYVPSNDFSIMISKTMFNEIFLPGIKRECQFYDRSIYHLDGPGALRHLDALLAIPELNALQFVPGAGNEDFRRWIEVYRKAQKAGKGIQVICNVDEIAEITSTLNPLGVYLSISGVEHVDTAHNILRALERWAREGRH
jgi:hypothetical protein